MNSRYADQGHLDVPQDDGTTRPLSTPRIAVAPPIHVVYPVREGDRLDLLATAVLEDSTRWWVIADANIQADALRLEAPGTMLAVPDA
jgi:nucleoid-associated protein YgaU